MALEEITNVNVSLQTTAVSRASFGTPIFIGAHRWFTERVRSYPSIEAVGTDFPTDSEEYLALQAAFSADVSPSVVKIGRRTVDSTLYTPVAATAIGQVYSISITGTDNVKVDATFTTITGSETNATIVADLVADLAGVVGVTVTDNLDGTFTVAPTVATDNFSVSTISRLTYVHTLTETPADLLTAIQTEDDDFYFVAAHDHTEAFILAMAAAIETRIKIYFVSVQEVNSIAALAEPATEVLGKLNETNYFRTSAWFHHEADTKFPEMAFISIAAPADPGRKIWGVNRVTGFSASKNPTTGQFLTFTERNNLFSRNANWVESVGGINIARPGKVSAGGLGEWIDVIRNRDFYQARLTEGLQNKMINAPVIPYTNSGINEIASVCNSVSSRLVSTETQPNVLQENNPYKFTFPRAEDVSFAEKQLRTLTATGIAFLAGAIQVFKLNVVLTYDNLQ